MSGFSLVNKKELREVREKPRPHNYTANLKWGIMALSYSINQTLERARRSNGHAVATVSYEGVEQTYLEFRDRVVRAATALTTKLGLKRGDVAGILALNSVAYFEYYFVCPWAGVLVTPVNIRLAPPEVAETLNDCSCKALFIDDAFLPQLEVLQEKVPSLVSFIYIGKHKDAPKGCVHYEELITEVTTSNLAATVGGDDTYGIFYTGGTTGKSKGVMLTHTNLLFNAYCVINALEYKREHRYLHCAPMFHGADQASTFALTLVGATHVFMPKFVPNDTLEVIQKRKVSHSLLVPTMFAMVLAVDDLQKYDLSSCQRFIYGASPMPESILLESMKAFPNATFVQGYGMTECAPVNTFLDAEDHTHRRKLTSAGKAVPHAEVMVVDENDKEVAVGVVGELVVRGPHVMKGYYNMPEQTAKALKNGWMHTGDGAVMDEDGTSLLIQ